MLVQTVPKCVTDGIMFDAISRMMVHVTFGFYFKVSLLQKAMWKSDDSWSKQILLDQKVPTSIKRWAGAKLRLTRG